MNTRIYITDFHTSTLVGTAVTAGYVYGLRDGLLIGSAQQGIYETTWIESDELGFERWFQAGVSHVFEGIFSVSSVPSFVPQGFVKTAEVTTVPVEAGIQFVQAARTPLFGTEAAPADLFNERLLRWKDQTAIMSSMEDMYLHSDYQRIIGMGQSALPLIFDQLRKEPDWLFWALESITGESPAPETARGNLTDLTLAWLRWGDEHGFGQAKTL